MVIREVGFLSFRNYAELHLEFSENVNLFVGKNGQGKTNLIEGLYFLSHLESFRTHRLENLITHGTAAAHLQATIFKGDFPRKARIELARGGRRVWLDDSPVGKLSEYITIFYGIVFNPDSLYQFRHFPGERRAFFNRFGSFAGHGFGGELRAFREVHAQKNRLLKSGDFSTLSEWNFLFAERSRAIVSRRQEMAESINAVLPDMFARLTGRAERLRLQYRPSLHGEPEACAKKLEDAVESEGRMGHALYGPHRDDFRLTFAPRRDDAFFSQGEYRISLMALKLALGEVLRVRSGFSPVLILDDLFSELDGEVRGHLSRYLHEIPNQIFITTTEAKDGDHFSQPRIMEIRDGRIV